MDFKDGYGFAADVFSLGNENSICNKALNNMHAKKYAKYPITLGEIFGMSAGVLTDIFTYLTVPAALYLCQTLKNKKSSIPQS